MVTGDWISYLDADDIYAKNGVEQIKKAIKKHKDKRYIFNLIIVENLFHLAVIKVIQNRLMQVLENMKVIFQLQRRPLIIKP